MGFSVVITIKSRRVFGSPRAVGIVAVTWAQRESYHSSARHHAGERGHLVIKPPNAYQRIPTSQAEPLLLLRPPFPADISIMIIIWL